MSGRKSEIGNSRSLHCAITNSLRKSRGQMILAKKSAEEVAPYMKRDGRIVIIIDKEDVRLLDDEIILIPEGFRTEDIYDGEVVLFVKKGTNFSELELNRIFLKAAGK